MASMPLQPRSHRLNPTLRTWSLSVRIVLSATIALHFAFIAISYSSNWKRSSLGDDCLKSLQPYLIGLNWHSEMLPVELANGEASDARTYIQYRTTRDQGAWKTWVDTHQSDLRWRRLARIIYELRAHDDEEGLGVVTHSLVNHAVSRGMSLQELRIVTDSNAIDPNAGTNAVEQHVLYRTAVVSLADGTQGLIPTIESTRSVPATN